MERFVYSFLWFVLLSSSLLAQVRTGQCGYDRWPVKILGDKDCGRVNFQPVDTSIAKLGAIPIHEIPYPYDRRIEPEELVVYRVKARLLRVQREKDSDMHLLLGDADESDKRMIAEIPAPECAEGTGHEQEYQAARNTLTSIRPNSIIEIVGVGFFDFLHEQHGGAKNGLELHPVLSIRRTD
jgi:hypothetical protein